MKQSNWHVLKTKTLNLPTVHGFLGDDGSLIIQDEGDGLDIFLSETVGIADALRGANLLHISEPEECAGSWRFSGGRDMTRGNAYTAYPLIFTKVSF